VVVEDWGTLKVLIGGEDVTAYRDIPCVPNSWVDTEPFGWKAAEISIPQISPYENLPDWLEKYSDIQIILVRPDLSEKVLWRGLFGDEEDNISETESGFAIQGLGSLFQADFYLKKPKILAPELVDLYGIFMDELNPDNHYRSGSRWGAPSGTSTGIQFQQAGSWEPLLTGYFQDLLGRAATEDGGQWTIDIQDDNTPILKLKDMTTTHWSMSVGQPGLVHNLSRDFTVSPNAFYGDGTDLQQCRWRNTRYPPYSSGEPPFFQPVIEDTATNRDEKDVATGQIVGTNPDWDNTVVRKESYQNFGSYITREEAADSAAIEYGRRQPAYVGTLVLTADPEEGSRFEIQAGQNFLLRWHRGVAGRFMHIAEVEVDWTSGAVTLQVDENARDYVTMAAVRDRVRENNDPTLKPQRTYRNSRAINDQKAAVWDCESGAGRVDPVSVGVGWTRIEVPAGTQGQVVNTDFTTDPPTPWAMGVFDREPPSMSGMDPFVDDDFWDAFDESTGLIQAWGAGSSRAGYYPGNDSDTDPDPITGVLRDDQSWNYQTQTPPWLFLMVYAADDCSISGLFRPGADY
jgi:hypothetical protein